MISPNSPSNLPIIIASAMIAGLLARHRYRSFFTGFLLGLVAGPMGLIGVLIGRNRSKATLWTGRLFFFYNIIFCNIFIFVYAAQNYSSLAFKAMFLFLPITVLVFPFILFFNHEPVALICFISAFGLLGIFAYIASKLEDPVEEYIPVDRDQTVESNESQNRGEYLTNSLDSRLEYLKNLEAEWLIHRDYSDLDLEAEEQLDYISDLLKRMNKGEIIPESELTQLKHPPKSDSSEA